MVIFIRVFFKIYFVCVHVCAYVYVHVFRCVQSLEEDICSHGAGVIDGCELLGVGAEN